MFRRTQWERRTNYHGTRRFACWNYRWPSVSPFRLYCSTRARDAHSGTYFLRVYVLYVLLESVMRCDYHKFLRKHTVPPTLPVGRDVWRRAPIHQIGSFGVCPWQYAPAARGFSRGECAHLAHGVHASDASSGG